VDALFGSLIILLLYSFLLPLYSFRRKHFQTTMQFRSILIIAFFVLGCQSSKTNNVDEHGNKQSNLQSDEDFNPYGYYFIEDQPPFNGLGFEWLYIPGKTGTPSIRLRSRMVGQFIELKAHQFLISRKQVSIDFGESDSDRISIKGQFLGNKGPIEDKVKTDDVVFQGTITIKGRQAPVSMTWSEGD
jgi:hypothetical protein